MRWFLGSSRAIAFSAHCNRNRPTFSTEFKSFPQNQQNGGLGSDVNEPQQEQHGQQI